MRGRQARNPSDNRTSAQIKAKGANLPVPVPLGSSEYFAQDPAVTVELRSSTGACWSSDFVPAGTASNDGERFKAKSP
jgi:hypothetical protein